MNDNLEKLGDDKIVEDPVIVNNLSNIVDYLPIGSVVLLKNGTKKTMIIGYLTSGEDDMVYDYSSCLFPEGVVDYNETLLFNHDDIKEVIFEGFKNEETEEFFSKIQEEINK